MADIKKVNRERGWPSSDSALDTAVVRLAANGEAVKVKRGTYRFGAEAPDEAVTDDERSAASEGLGLTLGSEIAA